MLEVDRLREEAARARRLSSGVADAAMARTFQEIAEEYEALIDFLARRPSDGVPEYYTEPPRLRLSR